MLIVLLGGMCVVWGVVGVAVGVAVEGLGSAPGGNTEQSEMSGRKMKSSTAPYPTLLSPLHKRCKNLPALHYTYRICQ